jgi:predicted ATPase/DNA-binding CsgD family transcriptional regulator
MGGDSANPPDLLIEPLTRREQEILDWLATDLSNREIAGRLVLAPTSVKWYTRQIYAKLGVNDRQQAIEKAKTLGLLNGSTSATLPPHNLPVSSLPFVGRQQELERINQLLADPACRLLTLVGPGGCGKTRLAQKAGAMQLKDFVHGVYFVSLAPLENSETILPTIASAIGFKYYSGKDEPRQQLLNYLREKSMLLILDNFEHLLDGVDLATEILQSSPKIKIIATSRARLNVLEEQLYPVSGLNLPDSVTEIQKAECYSAISLFRECARRVSPEFELTADNLEFVIRICRAVQGFPLGILLATGWLEMLTPPEIAAAIERDFSFLEADLSDLPERQRSMRAVFHQSWKILTEREREIFSAFSVFRGGFTAEAAHAVAGATLRDLMGLVNKSLIQRTPSGRYNLHELVRQYGEQKLLEAGKENAICQRHLEYYFSLTEQSLGQPIDWIQKHWLPRIDTENGNLRAALGWCLDSGNAVTGLCLASHLGYFWSQSGHIREGREWLEQFLARAPQPTQERASGLQYLGSFIYNMGNYASAFPMLNESLALFEALGNLAGVADTTLRLGWLHFALGNYAQSRQLMERSLKLYQDLNKPEDIAYAIEFLGDLACAEGDYVRARELLEQSATLQRGLEDKIRLCYVLSDLGRVLIHFGELDRSETLFRETMSIQIKYGGDTTATPVLFMGFAFLANARGQPLRAVRLLGVWETICKATGYHIEGMERPDYERNLASLRTQLDESTFETAWAEGAALTLDQAVELAMGDNKDEAS